MINNKSDFVVKLSNLSEQKCVTRLFDASRRLCDVIVVMRCVSYPREGITGFINSYDDISNHMVSCVFLPNSASISDNAEVHV